ncbi:chemotaxis protein CheW [candidate division KSB1 bacterium]|nr:MAG: chemotaxis protein CheW [candidate division KSB1 bacterium]
MAEEWFDEKETDTLKDKYLIFYLGDRPFAFEIRFVAEIIGIQKITPLPYEAESVKGVINLRGRVIPVVDARLRLGLEERDYDDRTCIVICKARDTLVGLIVDTVSEVVTIAPEQIEDPPQLQKNKQTPYLQGLAKTGNEVKVVLNMEKFIFAEEWAGTETAETEIV